MTVQWGKLVSERVDPKDKAVQLRKAERTAETILNVKLIGYRMSLRKPRSSDRG